MPTSRFALAALATFVVTFAFAAPVTAAPVTIGSPLTEPFAPSSCEEACTVVPTVFDEPGAIAKSPIDGTIVRWHILQGAPGFPYKLRVFSEAPGPFFTAAGTSAPAVADGPGLQTFSTNLPIKAGQAIGIDLPAGGPIGYIEEPGDNYVFFVPPLLDGQTEQTEVSEGELAFNAVVQPPPAISGISPTSGSFQGGTTVTITGSDFAGVTGVTFGSLPAQSFSVVSDSQISAVTPPVPAPGPLPVAVTTVAGTATSPTSFTGLACIVPKLKGKKLKRAKKRARRALCKVGKVKKIKGATAKTGKAVKQRPKPGKLLAPGAKVHVVLAP